MPKRIWKPLPQKTTKMNAPPRAPRWQPPAREAAPIASPTPAAVAAGGTSIAPNGLRSPGASGVSAVCAFETQVAPVREAAVQAHLAPMHAAAVDIVSRGMGITGGGR
jgi:hypothetical protein